MSKKAKVGQRVTCNTGHVGTIESINRSVAHVRWDDGTYSQSRTDQLYRNGGSGWIYAAIALALGLTIALGVWLASTAP